MREYPPQRFEATPRPAGQAHGGDVAGRRDRSVARCAGGTVVQLHAGTGGRTAVGNTPARDFEVVVEALQPIPVGRSPVGDLGSVVHGVPVGCCFRPPNARLAVRAGHA